MDDYLQVFEGVDVIFVGVRCPMDVINKREKARPGRFPGTALGHMDICHSHDDYDVDVDTSHDSPARCAEKVRDFLENSQPGAFERMKVRLS